MSVLGHIKDGIFRSLQIKGKRVIDENWNGVLRSLKINRDLEINGNLIVNNTTIDGDISKTSNAAFDAKKLYFDNLESQYYANGTVSWATFSADQALHKNKVVLLEQADFAYGTLRIQEACLLKLTQTIRFNPNRPTTWLDSGDMVTMDFNSATKIDPNRALDWFPDSSVTPQNDQYFEPEVKFAYGLGFFAALAIETANVILDLCGYTFEQHPEHALQQRFFAIIELADQPFMPLQGPSNFGAILRSASNCLIKNGTLGISSHHSIHGNDADGIMLYNLTFKDFEVAAVALNGSNDLFQKNLTITTNRRDIPVLGSYSAARFIRRFVKATQDMSLSTVALDNALIALNQDLDETFNDVIFNNGTTPAYLKNNEQVVDGTCYGFLINPKGVAVGPYMNSRNTPKAFESSNIHFINCTVNGIKGSIREIVALANPNGGMQVDTAGSILRFFGEVANEISNQYTYQGTTLSNVQIELARVKNTANVSTSYLGTLNIHDGIIAWKDDLTSYFEFNNDGKIQLYYANASPILIEGNTVQYDVKCNGDSMFHVNKGVMGWRIDGASGMYMVNCAANSIESTGEIGSNLCGSYITSHPDTVGTHTIGYLGGDAHGAIFSAVNDVHVTNFTVNNVNSLNAIGCGFTVQNESLCSEFNNIIVTNIESFAAFDPARSTFPNQIPIAAGITVKNGCKKINFTNTLVSGVSDNTPYQNDFLIRDKDVTFNKY